MAVARRRGFFGRLYDAFVDLVLGVLKSYTRMTAFITKEIVEVIRRPSVLFSLVLGPFVIMALFGVGYSGQRRPLNTVLVIPPNSNLPRTPATYQDVLGPAVNLVQIADTADAPRQQLERGQLDLLVVAPADVQAQFLAGRQSVIEIYYDQIDPVRDNYARFVADRQVAELNRYIIQRAVAEGQQYAIQQLGAQPSQIPPDVVAAPTRADLKNLAPLPPSVIGFYAPAVLALVLQHMGVTLTALSMVRERLGGAIDVFRVAPLTSVEILVGKYLAYAFFNLVIAAVVSILMIQFLGVPLLGDPRVFAGAVALLTFASLGLGLLISSTVDSERQAVQVSMLVLLASVFFSGFVLPLDEFQPLVRNLAYALPVTHGITLLQDTMLRGEQFRPFPLTMLVSIGLVLFVLTALSLRRAMSRA
jgi:ABC-2 type transport system permease protein